MKVSKYFDHKEFQCKCEYADCNKNLQPNEALVFLLESVRRKFGKPVTINSGYRCPLHNLDEGGKSDSQHLTGKAADIEVDGMGPQTVRDWLDETYGSLIGLGSYSSFTHVDVRGIMYPWGARWAA